jgi:membrane-associated phospholipid phosphatase
VRTIRRAALACALATAAFVVLAVLVAAHWSPLERLDNRIALDLNDYIAARRGQAQFWRDLTTTLSPAVLRTALVVVGVVLLLRRQLGAALFCGGVALGSLLMVDVTKSAVNRPRPHVPLPVASAPGASFPSGHATTSAAVALALIVVAWPLVSGALRSLLAGALTVVAAAVGFSRMILGVHFLSDVVGGWIGAVALVSGLMIVRPTRFGAAAPVGRPRQR